MDKPTRWYTLNRPVAVILAYWKERIVIEEDAVVFDPQYLNNGRN
jgi:hypothetical protein